MNRPSLQICATFWRSSLLMPSLHAASIPSSIAGCRGCCLTCNTCVNITATCFKVTTKISFGGIPNSSNPYAMLDYMDHFFYATTFFTQWLCPCGQCGHQPVFETITCAQQLLPRLPHRNCLEPSGTSLRNLHQHTPELSTNFWNLLRNSHQHTGTLRNLPEASSGTCSCDPHRHTPELIWAEDPISLSCWGKIQYALHLVLSFQSTRAQHSHQATTAAKVGATMFPDEASARPPLVVVMVVVEFAAETAVKDMTMATTIKRKDCIALTEIYRSTSTTSKNA